MIRNDNEIEITYRGETIKGIIVFKNRRAIGLEIVNPYIGLRIFTSTVPVFAMKYHSYLDEHGKLTDSSKEIVEKLLLDLFFVYGIFKRDKIKINEAFREIRKKFLTDLTDSLTNTQFSQQKKNLKRKLYASIITNVEYQKQLSGLKKKLSNYDYSIFTMKSAFLKHIETQYSIRLDTQVIDQLIKRFLQYGDSY